MASDMSSPCGHGGESPAEYYGDLDSDRRTVLHNLAAAAPENGLVYLTLLNCKQTDRQTDTGKTITKSDVSHG